MRSSKENPTLHQMLAGYRRFNAWERQEQRRELPRLSVEESLTRYFELCDLARTLAPGAERAFIEQDRLHWADLHDKLRRAARRMNHESTD